MATLVCLMAPPRVRYNIFYLVSQVIFYNSATKKTKGMLLKKSRDQSENADGFSFFQQIETTQQIKFKIVSVGVFYITS
jgi:hypothetical protein